MRSILITTFISILFSNYEKDIQTMFILAEPGDTIHLTDIDNSKYNPVIILTFLI